MYMLLHFSYLTLFLLAQTIDSTWHRCRRVTLAYEALLQLVGVHHQTWRIDTSLHTFLPIVRWYTFKLESTYLYLLVEYVFNCIKRKYSDVVITRKVFEWCTNSIVDTFLLMSFLLVLLHVKAIWKIKIKQQISGCFRTDSGADDFAKLHSIAETAVKNGNSMRLNLHVTNAILVAVQP